jgi:hypothetical protein
MKVTPPSLPHTSSWYGVQLTTVKTLLFIQAMIGKQHLSSQCKRTSGMKLLSMLSDLFESQ